MASKKKHAGIEALPAGRAVKATVRKVKRGGRYVLEIQRLASKPSRKTRRAKGARRR